MLEIISHRPDGITREDLHNLLYAERADGGPNTHNISVLVHHANKQLKPQGWRIGVTWMGPGARYRLVKLDADTVRQPPAGHEPRFFRRTQPARQASEH